MYDDLSDELKSVIRTGAAGFAERYGKPAPPSTRMIKAQVAKVNADGTLDLSYQGAELMGVAATTACAGAMPGDTVVCESFQAQLIATGVISTSMQPGWRVAKVHTPPSGCSLNAGDANVVAYHPGLGLVATSISMMLPGSNNPSEFTLFTCADLGLPSPKRKREFNVMRGWKGGSGDSMITTLRCETDGKWTCDTSNTQGSVMKHWSWLSSHAVFKLFDW